MLPRMNTSRLVLAAVLGAVLGVAAGCGGWKTMPAPVGYDAKGADPFAVMPEADRSTTIDVLYATDRSRTKYRTASKWYGERRGLALRLGTATVRIGSKGASWEKVSESSRKGYRPPMELEGLEEFGKLWTTIPSSDAEDYLAAAASTSASDPIRGAENRFVEEVNARLAKSEWKEVVVYVPGFNTPFTAPVYMMAQYKHFMGRDGVFVAYSWPAKSTFLGYSKQTTTAGVSARNLRELLLLLAQRTDAEQINIISYSAGAPVMSEALLQLRLLHADDTADELRRSVRIGAAVYAGADEDLDYFRNLYLDRFNELAENITVYTSADDRGLGLSRMFTTGSARLGGAISDLSEGDLEALRQGTVTSFVDVDDAKRAEGGGDLFSHAYWYLNPWVNMDVIQVMRTNATPGERGLIREDGEALWSFPKDYPARIREIAERSVR